jgi:signal transduction histidine kinase
VADRGAGLAPGVGERIFEPFFTTKQAGLGMGLAISRSIVEAHGGRLTTEPNPEGGAVFTFTLPVH